MGMDDHTSDLIGLSRYNTHGFCSSPGYTLRRHKAETLANAGCYEARQDWIQYFGPVEFGNCNPINGNFTAVVLPLTKPGRLRLVAYILKYAFLHANVVEVKDDGSSSKDNDEAFSLGDMETGPHNQNAKLGRKQIQAKMMLQLTQTDPVCAKRVMGVWQTMLETTKKDKSKSFANLEEHLEFRIIDTGAPFIESVMLFSALISLGRHRHAGRPSSSNFRGVSSEPAGLTWNYNVCLLLRISIALV